MDEEVSGFAKVFTGYAEWVLENASSPELTDKRFVLFLSTQEDAKDFLKSKNVDVPAFEAYCKKYILEEKKYNQEFFMDELHYNTSSDASGFFGKIIKDIGIDADYKDFIEEMVVAMEVAKASNKNNLFDKDRLFDMGTPEELEQFMDMGFSWKNICPDRDDLYATYNDDTYQSIGYDLLENLYAAEQGEDENENSQAKMQKTLFGESEKQFVGLDEECEKIIRLLSRKDKPNIIITGEKGVGKQSLLHLLRKKITTNTNNIGSNILLTITDFSNETQVEAVLEKAKLANAILCVDNAGNFMETYKDTLASYIQNKDFRIIGSALPSEYAKVANNKSINSYFEEIKLQPRSLDAIKQIVKANKKSYEAHYKIKISNDIIANCVEMSSRFLKKIAQPQASFKLLDQACTFANAGNPLSKKHINNALAEIANVCASDIHSADQTRLLKLSEHLSKNILGQKVALDKIRSSLLHQNVFPTENKPKASFLLAGPSGVGKTQSAKDLAKFLGLPLIHLNMAEYQMEMDVNKLIGAAPGYIGYDKGGVLVNQVLQKPSAVIVFDEIEKAHQSIYKILLGVLDEASLSDSQGNVARFDNSIIILTSNVGFSEDAPRPLGYGVTTEPLPVRKDDMIKKLSKIFAPEFLGRINEIITFQPLDSVTSREIVNLQLSTLSKTFEEKYGIKVGFSEEVKKKITKDAIHPKLGARNLANYINQNIKSELAAAYIGKSVKKGDSLVCEIDSVENKFKLNKKQITKSRQPLTKKSSREL